MVRSVSDQIDTMHFHWVYEFIRQPRYVLERVCARSFLIHCVIIPIQEEVEDRITSLKNQYILGILVTASQDESNNYHYNTICVVLITELVKLLASALLYCKR